MRSSLSLELLIIVLSSSIIRPMRQSTFTLIQNHRLVTRTSALSTSKDFVQRTSNQDTYLQSHRFWVRNEKLIVDIPISILNRQDVLNQLSDRIQFLNSSYFTGREQQHDPEANNTPPLSISRLAIPASEFGLVMVASHGFMLPIHEGQLQPQHALDLPQTLNNNQAITQAKDSTNQDKSMSDTRVLELTIFGFSRRAAHVTSAYTAYSTTQEEEITSNEGGLGQNRPVNESRLIALTQALQTLGSLSPEVLLGDSMAGSSASRIFRSFVAPRKNAVLLPEPVHRAAKRAAEQIELALRQLRADQATTTATTPFSPSSSDSIGQLRNTDRPLMTATQAAAVHPLLLVLDNLRSAFNVGSLFRTAETAGAAGIVTLGITPHPPIASAKLRKTGFSSIDSVPTAHYDDPLLAVKALRDQGYTIAAMETTTKAIPYAEYNYPQPLALILGNEVTGVDPRLMAVADVVLEIPTFGAKNSLNVASAGPIVVFEALRQWQQLKKEQLKKEQE